MNWETKQELEKRKNWYMYTPVPKHERMLRKQIC